MLDKKQLITLAFQTARLYQLDTQLVCAIVEQESRWNPYAIRFEPAFHTKYVAPQRLDNQTEAIARAFSWGLMQVMGQTARDYGYKGDYLAALCEPASGLDVGCRVLRGKLNSHPSSIEAGLLAWNGGGRAEYPAEVLARMSRYADV